MDESDITKEKIKEQAPPEGWPTVEPATAERRPRRRESPSMFGPVLLIAAGIYFLLNNLGYTASLNWAAVLQLWPLLLIFLGLNIIVRQVPRPIGSFLSALVAVAAVAVFGFALLAGEDNSLLARFGVDTNRDPVPLQRQVVDYAPEAIETAVVAIDFGAPAVALDALEDSRSLLQGVVTYGDDINLDTRENGSQAWVTLDTQDGNGLNWLNPNTWVRATEADRWQLGLNPAVVYDLRLDVGSGMVDLDLHRLTLTDFTLDGGSGSVDLRLPDGSYDAELEGASGAWDVWLPGDGRPVIDIDGGSGSLTLYLPTGMEARVIVNDGSGRFNLDAARFTQVSGQERDDGIWETAGYDDATDRLELKIDIGSGSVTIKSGE